MVLGYHRDHFLLGETPSSRPWLACRTHVPGQVRPKSSSFICIITCIDPETEWNEERFMASLARSEVAAGQISQHPLFTSWIGRAASQETIPGSYTNLINVRSFSNGKQPLESIPEFSNRNQPLISIPDDVLLQVLSHSSWFDGTTAFGLQQLVWYREPLYEPLYEPQVLSHKPPVWLNAKEESPAPMTAQGFTAKSPATFSPASFMTAWSTPRSTYTSPVFVSARSTPTSVHTGSAYLVSDMYRSTTSPFETIQEESDVPQVPPLLLKLKHEYLATLNEYSLLQSLNSEVNWSGKGQHVTFQPTEDVPLKHLEHLGASISATVDKVLCRRVALARKTMRCTPRFKVADALIEVSHLQKLQHFHIVQLVGSYLQGRNFSILMYPVADLHLGTFLEDTSELTYDGARYEFLSSIFGCLASAFNFIHKHSTKHMDVKPQNILVRKTLLREDWDRWRVYIADFGLSRDYTAQGHSQTDGRTSLTPRYCAPEVYNYESRGRSADVFSLGCVFLEILTVLAGQHPHDFTEFRSVESNDDSFHANLYQVALWAKASFGRGISHDFCDVKIDRSVCDLVEKMVSQEPSQRPTALELDLFFRGLPEGDYCRTKAGCCTRPPEPYITA